MLPGGRVAVTGKKDPSNLAIADASGHGLPAALLARDVITGLRMGMADDLKIIKAVERLNRVIHRSALSSKFVSLFYGEVEPNGNFLYCNAGHNPPLLRRPGSFQQLTQGKQWVKLDLGKIAAQRGIDIGSLLNTSPTPTSALAYLGGSAGKVEKVGSAKVQGVDRIAVRMPKRKLPTYVS